MKVRVLLEKLAQANPDAEVQVSVMVERDEEGEWSKSGTLNAVWVLDDTVCLDERRALQGATSEGIPKLGPVAPGEKLAYSGHIEYVAYRSPLRRTVLLGATYDDEVDGQDDVA